MANTVAPEYARFVSAQRPPAKKPGREGEAGKPLTLSTDEAARLLPVAARRVSGFFRPTKRTEVVWVEGESELAVSLATPKIEFGNGFVTITLAVRCDQTGPAAVRVRFACGSRERPAGLYAAAQRHPQGPELIVRAWGEALVAFAWQCLLDLVTGLAAATGKDSRGNLLVPVEIVALPDSLAVVPMARHRFTGSSGLKPATGSPR